MLLGLLLAGVIAAAPPAPAPALSPETQALMAPVPEAVARVRAEQAALPPPKDDAERLLRMQALDQAPRTAWQAIDFGKIPAEERKAAYGIVARAWNEVDTENLAALMRMMPTEGWFTISRYGRPAAHAAFLIAQHADLALWRRLVPVLEPLVAKGEVEGRDYALMYDRLAISEGRAQRYGSQVRCEGGRYVAYPIENPESVDIRRAAMGLPPEAEYMQKNYARPCG